MGALFNRIARGRIGSALAIAALVSASCGASASSAQQRDPGYETIILAPDEPVDPDLARFMETAGDALGRFARGYGEHRPPVPLAEVFSEKVTVFVGGTELVPDDRFEKLGWFPREEFLAFLGQFFDDEPIRRIGAEVNGAWFLSGIDAGDFVAANDLLDGQTCTGSFERLSYERMRDLLAETGTTIGAWGVAVIPGGEADFMRGSLRLDWKIGQMLYVNEIAPPIRSCCWEVVVMPDGTGSHVQMAFGPAVLVPYLASHVCFTRTGEGWRISAVAIRLPEGP